MPTLPNPTPKKRKSLWKGFSMLKANYLTHLHHRGCLRSFTWEISHVLRVEMSSGTFNLSDFGGRSLHLRRGLSLTPLGHRVRLFLCH